MPGVSDPNELVGFGIPQSVGALINKDWKCLTQARLLGEIATKR